MCSLQRKPEKERPTVVFYDDPMEWWPAFLSRVTCTWDQWFVMQKLCCCLPRYAAAGWTCQWMSAHTRYTWMASPPCGCDGDAGERWAGWTASHTGHSNKDVPLRWEEKKVTGWFSSLLCWILVCSGIMLLGDHWKAAVRRLCWEQLKSRLTLLLWYQEFMLNFWEFKKQVLHLQN